MHPDACQTCSIIPPTAPLVVDGFGAAEDEWLSMYGGIRNWIFGTALFLLSSSTVFYFAISPAFEENGMAVMKPAFMFSTLSMLLIVIITILTGKIE